MNLDNVVPAEIELFEPLEVPEDSLRNGSESVPGELQGFEGGSEGPQIRTTELRYQVVWKSDQILIAHQ